MYASDSDYRIYLSLQDQFYEGNGFIWVMIVPWHTELCLIHVKYFISEGPTGNQKPYQLLIEEI